MEVTFSDGSRMRCEDTPFAEGGEGRVYFSEGKTHVIKLYLDSRTKALVPPNSMPKRTILENILGRFNLTKDDPSRKPYFGWPDAIVVSPGLGIRMPLIRDQKPLVRYISGKFYFHVLPAEEKGPWSNRVSIVYKMARIFRWMHLRGLCHSDLNPNNFMVNLKTGKASLIDCDGLVVPNFAEAGVYGMKEYMAPEIVMGKAMPSIDTDKFSLAVLIYKTLLFNHPLKGPKIHHSDPEKDDELTFGANALYIEHPTDRSNRPDRLPYTTDMFTNRVKNLFLSTFTEGLKSPIKRPQPGAWEAALMRMADRIVQCQNAKCPMSSFVVPESNVFVCPWCKTPYRMAQGVPALYLFRLGSKQGSYVSDDWTILGGQNRPILRYHVDTTKTPESSNEVVAHFSLDGKGKWHLVNDCLDNVRLIEPGQARIIGKGSSLEIKDYVRVMFGREENFRVGEVRILKTP